MSAITALYDGWPLAYEGNSPAALHLLTLLARRPQEVRAVVALPHEPLLSLPPDAEIALSPAANTPPARLAWEQQTLPALAKRTGAHLLHLTGPRAPLFGETRRVFSTSHYKDEALGAKSVPLLSHLREAMGVGGATRASAILVPEDLPTPPAFARIHAMPPDLHPAFLAPPQPSGPNGHTAPELPETYVLYSGSHSEWALRRLLAAWRWAAEAVGDLHPLVVAGLSEAETELLAELLKEASLESTVRALPVLPLSQWAALYRGCSLLLHPGQSPAWGSPLRLALACGKPVVAPESDLHDALVGPAAYLVPEGEDTARRLGAATITLLVEQDLNDRLSAAASTRANGWDVDSFGPRLGGVYRAVLTKQA